MKPPHTAPASLKEALLKADAAGGALVTIIDDRIAVLVRAPTDPDEAAALVEKIAKALEWALEGS